jgi:polyisoprenoid-binding protein YceI
MLSLTRAAAAPAADDCPGETQMIRACSTVFVLATLAATLVARSAAAATWEIDPAHTTIAFSVRHMMVSNVRGRLATFGGRVDADPTSPEAARIEATIDAASIDTGNAKRDEHLRGPDFLDAAAFPTITFRSTEVETAGAGGWKVTGDLTLHGVTRPVVLDVAGVAPPIKDPTGNLRAGATVRTTIDRKDFGITFGKTLDNGGAIVGDQVAITIDVEVTRPPDPAAGP